MSPTGPDGHSPVSGSAQALVVDTAPEIGVVLGIRNRDALADMVMPGQAAREFQFLGVDVESIDIVENAFGIVDDAPRRGAVPVARRQ
ncbi:hypothetical protein H7H73_32415 [Mycobacterium rufum]|uniref:Uncharacterized protein n=1 Tax=Mycolicibacterium rufum TaxID=318424 RepID=A0A9X2YHX5_9MYCO|nr:hypothetical protein [Mycolicibacterium rufum]